MQVCEIVHGRYEVEVRLVSYNNPTGRCPGCRLSGNDEVGCCDTFRVETCEDSQRCDSFFVYCLRPLNSTVEGGCANFETKTSNSNLNDGPVDFSRSTVLGLPNPFLLQGLTDAYTVSVMYQASD